MNVTMAKLSVIAILGAIALVLGSAALSLSIILRQKRSNSYINHRNQKPSSSHTQHYKHTNTKTNNHNNPPAPPFAPTRDMQSHRHTAPSSTSPTTAADAHLRLALKYATAHPFGDEDDDMTLGRVPHGHFGQPLHQGVGAGVSGTGGGVGANDGGRSSFAFHGMGMGVGSSTSSTSTTHRHSHAHGGASTVTHNLHPLAAKLTSMMEAAAVPSMQILLAPLYLLYKSLEYLGVEERILATVLPLPAFQFPGGKRQGVGGVGASSAKASGGEGSVKSRKKNDKLAFFHLQQAAEMGQPQAQYWLGNVYASGIFGKEGALSASTPAASTTGENKLKKRGKRRGSDAEPRDLHHEEEEDTLPTLQVPSDIGDSAGSIEGGSALGHALMHWHMAAMGGVQEAQMTMGYRHLAAYNADVKGDKGEAAAAGGGGGSSSGGSSSSSSGKGGGMMDVSFGVPGDCEKALAYYEEAANVAMDEMEASPLRGKVVPATDQHRLAEIHIHGASSALSYHNKPDELEEALEYLRIRATHAHDTNSALTLASLHHHGLRGVSQDMRLALKYYLLAASPDGSSLSGGDLDTNQQHWDLSKDQRDAAGQAAKFFLLGMGVERNAEEAYKYMRMGAPGGIRNCTAAASGTVLEEEDDEDEDDDEYNDGTADADADEEDEEDDDEVDHKDGSKTSIHNSKTQKKKKKKQLVRCDGEALNTWGLAHVFGIPGLVEVNVRRAIRYFTLAVEMGSVDAQYHLAMTKMGWRNLQEEQEDESVNMNNGPRQDTPSSSTTTTDSASSSTSSSLSNDDGVKLKVVNKDGKTFKIKTVVKKFDLRTQNMDDLPQGIADALEQIMNDADGGGAIAGDSIQVATAVLDGDGGVEGGDAAELLQNLDEDVLSQIEEQLANLEMELDRFDESVHVEMQPDGEVEAVLDGGVQGQTAGELKKSIESMRKVFAGEVEAASGNQEGGGSSSSSTTTKTTKASVNYGGKTLRPPRSSSRYSIDYKRTVNNLLSAAQHGHVQSQHRLGIMYARGIGVKKNCPVAVQHLRRVAEASPAMGQRLRLGYRLYKHGKVEAGLRHYLAAAESGVELAQSNAAWLLERGYCLGMDRKSCVNASQRMWRAASRQGNADASMRVGDFHYYRHLEEQMEEGSGSGGVALSVRSMIQLEWPFLLSYATRPELWVRRARTTAVGLVRKGLKMTRGRKKKSRTASDEPLTMSDAPTASSTDKEGAHQSKTCTADDGTCQKKDSTAKPSAPTVDPRFARQQQNFQMAAQYYRKAADANSPQANFNLGFLYEWGLGLKQDFPLAKRHYDLAASSYPDAALAVQIALASMKAHMRIVKFTKKYQERWGDTRPWRVVLGLMEEAMLGTEGPTAYLFTNDKKFAVLLNHMQSLEMALVGALSLVLVALVRTYMLKTRKKRRKRGGNRRNAAARQR